MLDSGFDRVFFFLEIIAGYSVPWLFMLSCPHFTAFSYCGGVPRGLLISVDFRGFSEVLS
jgi:hypothetical protein